MNRSITRIFAGPGILVLALVVSACGRDNPQPAAESEPLAVAAPATSPAAGDSINLQQIGYSRGVENAPVTVYEFSDFGCAFCAMFAQGTYPELHREFVATGRVRWTYVPFVIGMFPNGAEAARASECAGEQDRFWDMHDLLFGKQKEWKANRSAASLFGNYAEELKLDEKRFAACYREDRGGQRTALNNRAANALGVRATPTFFVNGRLVEGALPAEQFRQLLTMALGAH